MSCDRQMEAMINEANAHQAYARPGYGVSFKGPTPRCGTVAVYMGYTASGLNIVHEFNIDSSERELAIESPAAVLRGTPYLSRYAPGWKRTDDGGIRYD
jgi:hypothetical protein